ncbi:MAG: methionyl-tRNA formyltransferase [Bacteroidia bacterium]
MTIGVLSSGKISIPLIQALMQHRLLAWVAVTDEKNEGVEELIAYLQNLRVPFFLMKKEEFATLLLEKMAQTNVFSLFVLGFPWKLPVEILDFPTLGCWNFHFGALPEYRGNAPVFWQMKQLEKFSVLTVHKMAKGFDEGAVAHVEKTPILVHDTFGTVEKKLSFLAVNAMSVLVEKLFNDTLSLTEQNHSLAKVYKKPVAIDVCINWQMQTAQEIRALVTATNPWNKGAYTRFQQQYVRLLEVNILENKKKIQAKAGTIIKADNEGLWVMCKDNLILKVDILYSDDGYFTGTQFVKFGITKGAVFE